MSATGCVARSAAIVIVAAVHLAAAARPGVAAEAGYSWTRVAYVTPAAVYIDAGSAEGLVEGAPVEVVRADTIVARLEVVAVSSRRAMCRRAPGDAAHAMRVDDPVRFVAPADDVRATGRTDATSQRRSDRPDATRRRGLHGLGLRGRIGVRLLAVLDRTSRGRALYEPGLDLRLTGDDVASTPLGFAIDVRARRSYRSDGDGEISSAGRAKVYRLSSTLRQGDSGLRMSAGRQISPSLAPVSVFDGLLVEYAGERWQTGAFSGTQPDAASFAYSNDIREHGGYLQFDPSARGFLRSSVALGVIGSYQASQANREFAFLHGRASNRRTSLYLTQEVDLNRAWREEAEGTRLTFTSTFANARHRIGRSLTLSSGYDNRRSVRLYRDRITPETEFDDSYRRGVWGGVDLEHGNRFRIGARAQDSRGGPSGDAASYTLSVSASRVSSLAAHAALRGTRYASNRLAGWLGSVRVGAPLVAHVDLDLELGVRDERRSGPVSSARRLLWLGGSLEASLTKNLFGVFTYEHSGGADEQIDHLYTSLGYRL